ncbi:hypothetical protein KSF_107200 [Reticulibacter mediterranei]|uniref:Uncharacterized protein n=1 Tax=Reticulibacter mediterranei TaxID=2778369 RepID=A0A8J3N6S5_9CHLR|nr:hypothetical protein [Reticulibacter mediterranei]GHP00673.1 hypothetical protein KSF_107200 [Reticulibacter mediterranei]
MTLPPDAEIPLSMQDATDFLTLLLSITEMLQLYQECFPEEFAHDEAQQVSIFPEQGHDYSPREVHFFHLVNQHYFPMPLHFLPDDIYGERQLTAFLPIEPMGFDLYEEEQYQELDFGWKLLLYLLGAVDEEWLNTYREYASEELFEVPVSRDAVSEALLLQRCAAQGEPLASFALTVQMLRNNTDSVWLNVTMEDVCRDFSWTKEEMEEVRQQYHLACELIERANAFCQWLEENPVAHFALVARLWNVCARDTQHQRTPPKMRQIAASEVTAGVRYGEWFGIALPERIADARGA